MPAPRPLALSVLIACACGAAVAGSRDTLDARIRARLAADHVPGLSFVVIRGGRIVRSGAYGYANVEWKASASVRTKFEMASISKMFAGTAARVLIEEGKLDPESPIGQYFHGVPESWRGMKVRHLITMSSGLPEDFASDLIPYEQDVTTPFDDASMVRAFFGLKMAAPVGARFVYSSPNYAILGMIVSNVSGMPFPRFVRERVFAPAGMSDSSYIDNTAIVPERAEGYRRAPSGDLKRGWYLGQYLHSRPDDGVLSTAADLGRWLIALNGHEILRAPEKLWESTISDAGRPLDYGYGWIQHTWLGHRRQEHAGGYRTGFHTFIARYPDDDLGVAVLTNCDFSPVRDYVNMLTREYIRDARDPERELSTRDSDPEHTARAIAALQAIAGGRVEERLMYADAVEPIGLDELSGFLRTAREFRYAGRGQVPGGGLLVHGHRLASYQTIAMQIADRTQFVTVYRDPSGRIAYLEETN